MDNETMYTLGQIARAIWQGPGELPEEMINLISQPASFLAKATQHKNCNDLDEIGHLIKKIETKTLKDPKAGVSLADQSPFWLGYYHYLNAIGLAKNFGIDEMIIVGETLYGKQWQTDLAKALKLSDARRIRQWLSGDRPIPTGVWADIAGLLRHKELAIQDVLKKLLNN